MQIAFPRPESPTVGCATQKVREGCLLLFYVLPSIQITRCGVALVDFSRPASQTVARNAAMRSDFVREREGKVGRFGTKLSLRTRRSIVTNVVKPMCGFNEGGVGAIVISRVTNYA
ncbi:hypothetical protein BHE74_00010873 [Ensete ventricosum]|nr:hypothetical protein GW17_00001898 [Ensete ventricosum]RWW80764.1 hypothetical protein BHE74_00010873 [Ensete ventricosum]